MSLYLAISDIDDYHTTRGNTAWVGTDAVKSQAAWRAQTWLDTQNFVGERADREQDNAWPRVNAKDIPGDEVPVQIGYALCEAALIELVTPGAFSQVLERGGQIRQETISGAVSVSYFSGAPAGTTYTSVMNHLRGLVYSTSVVRVLLG